MKKCYRIIQKINTIILENELKKNYQRELDEIIAKTGERRPRLLLHACCAPCSSYVLKYLTKFFEITLFFYNPNISTKAEYDKRADELKRLISEMPLDGGVSLICADYAPEEFYRAAKGLENEPERGARCTECFKLRLSKTAELAREMDMDYFCTTLTISPHKNSALINDIGEEYAKRFGVPFLPSDFKKKEGFKRSTQLSEQYHLYRQNYCGCAFSRLQSEKN